jgi:hypothetical protein
MLHRIICQNWKGKQIIKTRKIPKIYRDDNVLPEIERDHPIMEPNDHQKYEGL